MSKRNILTAIGIALSCAIAIGGWALVDRLIDVRSAALMSATGVTPIAMPIAVPLQQSNDTANGYIFGQLPLTEQEMVSVLRNWEAPGRTVPHEPTPEQATMEEAVTITKNWLALLAGKLNVSDRLFDFDIENTSAHLSQNQQRDGNFLSPAYSFWTVSFQNNYVNATLIINAIEGQVWRTEVTTVSLFETWTPDVPNLFYDDYVIATGRAHFEINQENISSALNAFVSYLGIDVAEGGYNRVFSDDPNVGASFFLVVFEKFADGAAYVALRVTGSPIVDASWGQGWLVSSFSMYLGGYPGEW